MDNAPWFDRPDLFDQRRIRLADIDGSGVTDIIYLGRRRRELYFNQSGNSWSEPRTLSAFPAIDDLASRSGRRSAGQRHGLPRLVIAAARRRAPADALHRPDGRPEAASAGQDGQQPWRGDASCSTRRRPSSTWPTSSPGRPWITSLPFPVHVVERVETSIASAATVSSPATPTITATSTASSASSAASAWSSNGTPKSSRPSARAATLPERNQHRRSLRMCRLCSPRPGFIPASISGASMFLTSLPACWTRTTWASTTASPA